MIEEFNTQYIKRIYHSPSSLAAFARCPRYFFYSAGCRLIPKQPEPALVFGEAIHIAIGRWYSTDSTSLALEAFDTIWSDDLADHNRSRAVGERIIEAYAASRSPALRIYEPVSFKDLISTSALATFECACYFHHPECRLPFYGRVDCLVRHKHTGEYWVMDFKTSSRIGGLADNFDLNIQTVSYPVAVSAVLGTRFAGTVVEVLPVMKTQFAPQLFPVLVSDTVRDDFIKWFIYVDGHITAMESSGEFPKQFSGCAPYSMFGIAGYQCRYAIMCKAPSWLNLIDLFAKGTYNA